MRVSARTKEGVGPLLGAGKNKVLIGILLIAINLFVLWRFARTPLNVFGPLSFGGYRLDLDVYRIGSTIWRHGGSLYGHLPDTSGGINLPFTYPPAAAIIFSPLSLIPFPVASVLITAATVVSLLVVLMLTVRSLGLKVEGANRWLLVGLLLPFALLIEPVRQTLGFGQINVLLMVLVALDCLTTTKRWPRGVLIGLAAAVKLTPAAFILFFAVRKDWRGALYTIVGFVVATGLGFVLDPHDSVLYWTKLVFNSGRIGGIDYAGNQSMLAVITRFGVTGSTTTVVWGLLVIATLVIAAMGMRRALNAGQIVVALGLNAVAELLCSPISWSHHWVWAAPLLLGLGVLALRTRAWPAIALASVGVLLIYLGPQWWFPANQDRELQWAFWQQIIGSSYVYYGIVLLITAAVMRYRPNRDAATGAPAIESVDQGAVSAATASRVSSAQISSSGT
ncbi:MAG TPA: glycosyltransferase 87 family protein [Pseudonocardiaceae bacterium]|nr:glycosyltransferase 87 family protein [Pseudonocardiaceae bacterium]